MPTARSRFELRARDFVLEHFYLVAFHIERALRRETIPAQHH